MNSLIAKVCKDYSLNSNSLKKLIEEMEPVSFQKGEYIVAQGERNSNLYIVKDGLWRAFRTNNGEEFSLWLSSGGEISFQVWCYTQNTQSEIYIQSVTPSSALVISKSKLDELCNTSLELANLVRNIFEHHARIVETDILFFADNIKAEQRYLSIMSKYPELAQSLPLKSLASYLYITPQSLSRIRAGIKKRNIKGV